MSLLSKIFDVLTTPIDFDSSTPVEIPSSSIGGSASEPVSASSGYEPTWHNGFGTMNDFETPMGVGSSLNSYDSFGSSFGGGFSSDFGSGMGDF